MFFAPPLSQLEPSTAALALALLSLVPPVWIALMRSAARPTDAARGRRRRRQPWRADFAACVLAALAVTLTHALSALPSVFPLGAAERGARRPAQPAAAPASSSPASSPRSPSSADVSRLISPRAVVEAWLARGVLAIALALFLSRIVLRPLALAGARGAIVAAAFGAALAAAFGPRATEAGPGLDQALSGLVPRWATRSRAAAIGWLAVAAVAVWLVERQAATVGLELRRSPRAPRWRRG